MDLPDAPHVARAGHPSSPRGAVADGACATRPGFVNPVDGSRPPWWAERMSSRRHVPALALAAVALSGALLSGCVTNNTSDSIPDTPLPDSETSQSPNADEGQESSEQSVAAACGRLQSTLDESEAALQDGLSEISGDPTAAVQALQSFSAEFAQTRDELGNAEVREVADEAAVALDRMIDDLEVAVTDPGSFDLDTFVAESVPALQEQLAAIGEVCAQ